MNQPAMDILIQKTGSKYSLVVLAAKRARMLIDDDLLEQEKQVKPVTRALYEIAEGKITYAISKEAIK